jgi:hypothetical protein
LRGTYFLFRRDCQRLLFAEVKEFDCLKNDIPDRFEAFQREQFDLAIPLGAYYGKAHAILHLLFGNGLPTQ